MSDTGKAFQAELFAFLKDLRRNNTREWFQANKERYEEDVRHPALQFISDFGPHLRSISRHYVADPRPVGSSLFRIHRDVRFSRDTSPYKTQVGIQFRHKEFRNVHSPGFYLHLEPRASFAGIGIWHPDGPALARIRAFIVENPEQWKRTVSAKGFRRHFELGGDSLKREPKGYDPDHPLIEDLKRKDFVAFSPLEDSTVTAPGFLSVYEGLCRAGAPFIRYLCDALDVAF